VEVRHSTATLSPAALLGLYGLRLMHRLNISLSRFGLRAGRAVFLSEEGPNPNPMYTITSSLPEYNSISTKPNALTHRRSSSLSLSFHAPLTSVASS
jgi:hypothetical protein